MPTMSRRINRLGIVSFDRLAGARLHAPLSQDDTQRAMTVLDANGCDALLFALGWGSAAEVKPDWSALHRLQSVLLGVEDAALKLHQRGDEPVLLPSIDMSGPRRTAKGKAEVVAALPDRVLRGAVLLFGAEVNAFTMLKAESRFEAPEGWQHYIEDHDIRVILNPSATYMRRWEMKRKRALISTRGRTVVSVWNRTTVGESALPWTVFQDGTEVTGAVERLSASDERLTLAALNLPPVRATY